MSTALDRVGIRVAPLSRRIVIARFGKDPTLALEKRDAMNEFWQAIVQYAFDGRTPDCGESAEITFGGGDQQYTLTLQRKGQP